MDKFSILQKRVKRALAEYEKLRKDLGIKDPMLYETIQRESQPFIKGHFTLAVLGEMSAGKSTFINALLGKRGLLPSAHGQTTCVLTEIVDSDTDSIEVTFANRDKKNLDSKSLHSLVAIPAEYDDLPINEINRLITQEGLSYKDICKRKKALSQLQGGIEIDESLLREYVSSHNNSNIPTKVIVKLPLPEAFKGWRIVDTPGVESIGGIEQATKDFINSKDENGYNNVDAIIFVNSGLSQMQRSGFNRFVEDTFDTIYEEARRRMFLIITCAADPKFIANKKEELDRAKKLFIDKYKLKEDRLVCVDSICSMFLEYVKGKNLDLKTLKKKNVPEDWTSEDWEASIITRNVFRDMLDEDEVDLDNKNLIKYFDKYSGINELREKLNDFAEQEKSKGFRNLMTHINKDVTTLRLLLKKNEEMIGHRLKSTKVEFAKKVALEKDKLDQLKQQKDFALQKIRTQYSKQKLSSKFEDIESQVLGLRNEVAIYKVRNKAEILLGKVDEVKTNIYERLSSEFESAFDSLQDTINVKMTTIAFDIIAKNVEKQNTTKGEIIGYEQKRTTGFAGGVKRFFGSIFRRDSWGYEDDYTKPLYAPDIVNHEKKLKDFKDTVITEFQKNLKTFIRSMSEKIEIIGDEVSKTIDKKVSSQQAQYDAVLAEDNTSNLEKEYNLVAEKLEAVELAIKTIESI